MNKQQKIKLMVLILFLFNFYTDKINFCLASEISNRYLDENTCSKGLARSTLEPKLIHAHRKLDIIEENDALSYSPHPMPSSDYEIYGKVVTTFKIGTLELICGEFGVLIGPSHVLTHAESLFRHKFNFYNSNSIFETPEEKIWAYEAVFTPYLENNELGPQKTLGHTLIAPRQWVESDERSYNYGLIVLEEPIGETLGWASLKTIKDDLSSEDKNITATFVNFRANKYQAPRLMPLEGQITHVTPNQIFYSVTSNEELLGDVVLSQRTKNLGCPIVGFGTNSIKNVEDKKALRITPDIFRQIIAWQEGNYPTVDQEIEFKTNEKMAQKPYNDPQAQFYMAEYYKNIIKDDEKAFRWYMIFNINDKASNKLLRQTDEKIADFFYSKKLYNKAIVYYEDSETLSSIYKLKTIYEEKGDLEKAEKWHRRAIQTEQQILNDKACLLKFDERV